MAKKSKTNPWHILGFIVVLAIGGSLIGHKASGAAPKTSAGPAHVTEIVIGNSETSWIDGLLDALQAPHSSANVRSFASWIKRETYSWPPKDSGGVIVNNPLNTGRYEPGSKDFNSTGVKIYPSLSVGLKGTYDTLTNGHYPDILRQLRAGNGLRSNAGSGLRTWSDGAYGST